MYCVKGGFTIQIHIGWRFICGKMTQAGKAAITGGLGAVGHQQAAPGIYRSIACYYYQHQKARVEYCLYQCYTLIVSARQIENLPIK
jgi:hypothetical protein